MPLSKARRNRERREFRQEMLRSFRTNRDIEDVAMVILSFVSMLHALAEAGSPKGKKCFSGVASVVNSLAQTRR